MFAKETKICSNPQPPYGIMGNAVDAAVQRGDIIRKRRPEVDPIEPG